MGKGSTPRSTGDAAAAPASGTVIFKEVVKHNGHTFAPGIPIGFEDPDAAPYFTKCGWADPTTKAPVMTFELGQIDIDPGTIQNGTGLLVRDIVVKQEAA